MSSGNYGSIAIVVSVGLTSHYVFPDDTIGSGRHFQHLVLPAAHFLSGLMVSYVPKSYFYVKNKAIRIVFIIPCQICRLQVPVDRLRRLRVLRSPVTSRTLSEEFDCSTRCRQLQTLEESQQQRWFYAVPSLLGLRLQSSTSQSSTRCRQLFLSLASSIRAQALEVW